MVMQTLSDKNVSEPELNLPLSFNGAGQISEKRMRKWPVSVMIDFIVKNHHVYVTDALPKMIDLLDKAVTEYGLEHPELEEVFTSFHSLVIHFCAQMRKEELELFPVIKELASAAAKQKNIAYFPFESIRSQIDDIAQDHAIIEEGLANIRKLTNNFTAPANVCYPYCLLFRWLEDFERDIHQHEYLEDAILFTRAIAIEESMR